MLVYETICYTISHACVVLTCSFLILTATTTISNFPFDTVVRVNKTAFFHCEASFNPTLDITYDWYHNDYHIQFIKVRVIGDLPFVEEEEYFERVGIQRV